MITGDFRDLKPDSPLPESVERRAVVKELDLLFDYLQQRACLYLRIPAPVLPFYDPVGMNLAKDFYKFLHLREKHERGSQLTRGELVWEEL